jgi:hypothetical protein
MITNDGKELISKYLLGQVPSYASYLSIGCGAKPLEIGESLSNDIHGKQLMDFEMTRVPISSKGFVDNSVTYSITNKQLSGNTAILTTSVEHDIAAGESIIVYGVDQTFNGQFKVKSVTPTTFRYNLYSSNVSSQTVDPNGSVLVSRTKISLTAELPADNRYEITEIGIWSDAGNSLATTFDSRMIFNFSQDWKIHSNAISDPQLNSNLGFDGTGTSVNIQETANVFYADTADTIFQNSVRKLRYEGLRNLNKSLLMRGDTSTITGDIDGVWVGTGTHIHLNNISFNISGNNSSDFLKLAFSMINKNAVSTTLAKSVKILMEFYKTEANTNNAYAKAQIYVPGAILEDNSYNVASFQISQAIDYSNESADPDYPYTKFYISNDFNSSDIRICRIFTEIIKADDTPSTEHYIGFDGFRIDNTTENPVYKMSGYSVVRKNGRPITKLANTNNYIDFRFSLGVS